ncbi:hypothetical protein [Dactylosporangium sp. NPDC000521]|uniref:hypothetical protein n=1 Tax=Dactylosporangium sp. NPDC000521 TaxID=3363975 RepID=UPI0036C36C9C
MRQCANRRAQRDPEDRDDAVVGRDLDFRDQALDQGFPLGGRALGDGVPKLGPDAFEGGWLGHGRFVLDQVRDLITPTGESNDFLFE